MEKRERKCSRKGEGSDVGQSERKEKRRVEVRTERETNSITKQRDDINFGKVLELILPLHIRKKVSDQVEYSFIYSTNIISNIKLVRH